MTAEFQLVTYLSANTKPRHRSWTDNRLQVYLRVPSLCALISTKLCNQRTVKMLQTRSNQAAKYLNSKTSRLLSNSGPMVTCYSSARLQVTSNYSRLKTSMCLEPTRNIRGELTTFVLHQTTRTSFLSQMRLLFAFGTSKTLKRIQLLRSKPLTVTTLKE